MSVGVIGTLVPVMAAVDVTVAVVVAALPDPAAISAVVFTVPAVGRRAPTRVADAVAVVVGNAVIVPTGVPARSARVVGPTPGRLAARNSAFAFCS